MRLLLIGAPGAGKGTQAVKLAEHFGVTHISSGDLLRQHVTDHTSFGAKVKEYVSAGDLVPDQLVLDMLRKPIVEASGSGGYVLDGFPRTMRQAEALKKELQRRKERIDKVILINTPDAVVQERLAQRRSCPDPLCGAVYNLKSKPPKKKGRCDICNKELVIRDDDRPETIRARQQLYWHETAPLIDYYDREGLLTEIPGSGPLDDITRQILEIAEKIGRKTVRRRISGRTEVVDGSEA